MAKHRRVKVVPWLELVPTKKRLADFYTGAGYWRRVTDTMIVSVDPGHESVFADLQLPAEGMEVTPGLKTYPLLDRFDSVTGWRKVAHSVDAILKHCPGATSVLLENETAVRPVWQGTEKVDFRRLKRAVRQLPRDVEYLWWPTYAGHSFTIQDRYFAVANALDSGLLWHVRFIDRRLADTSCPDDVWMRYAALRLEVLTYLVPISQIRCGGAKRPKDFWSYKQVPSVLDLVEGDEAIIYPGSVMWVEAAKDLGERLPARRRRRG